MNIAALVDLEVMDHLAKFGTIKNADPMVQHLLKTSDEPLLRFRREWMRATALKQCLEATKNQNKRNSILAKHPQDKKSSAWLEANVEPWMADSMRRHHKADWNDPSFKKFVKREEPAMFPKRHD